MGVMVSSDVSVINSTKGSANSDRDADLIIDVVFVVTSVMLQSIVDVEDDQGEVSIDTGMTDTTSMLTMTEVTDTTRTTIKVTIEGRRRGDVKFSVTLQFADK